MPTLPRAQLSWTDDAGTGFIHVDVVPSLENTLSSTVTEFPLEDGSIISEHIIHHPELLRLEIAQTQIPFEDSSEDGDPLEFVKTSIPLKLPKTRFQPKGLLFLLLQAEGLVGAVTGAVGGLLGLGSGAAQPTIEVFRPPYSGKDRINDLYDKLATARLRGSSMKLEWLGRRWAGFCIDQIVYTRTKGTELGRFSVSLKQVTIVSTATTKLPTPSEARLKAGKNGGNRPGAVTGANEKDAAENSAGQSLLSSLKDSLLGG
jgi:hypothetical protein